MTSMPDFKYLFVGGCARSGTTALTHLANAHDDVAIGIERYNSAWGNKRLTPDLFEEKRFFEVRDTDTRAPDAVRKRLEEFKENHGADKYAMARVRGDKNPMITRHYDMLRENFQSYKIAFIVRNPFSVALSFQKRFENKNDTFRSDGYQAIHDWNSSIRTTLAAIKEGMPIFVVLYDRVLGSLENALAWFDALGLDPDKADLERVRYHVNYKKSMESKTAQIHESMMDAISQRCQFGVYRALAHEHCVLRHAGSQAAP
ncbi:MAG: sulfotransferase [Pseudomonadota bacterium]